MLKLHNLPSQAGSTHRVKRLGRGNSSGTGTTAGRGSKGQLSRTGRGKIPAWFEGGQTPIGQKLPKKRGFRRENRVEYYAVNLDQLEKLDNNAVVTQELMVAQKLTPKNKLAKILGMGKLNKKLTVQIPCSGPAKTAIEAAGGSVAPAAAKKQKKEASSAKE